MFNPFHPFTPELLKGMTEQEKRYFVRQSFGALSVLTNGELSKRQYLITHYTKLVTAQDHYATIKHDPNRFFYDWQNPEHQEKLLKAAALNKEYRVYGAVLRKEWKNLVTETVEGRIRSYIDSLGWQPKRNEKVDFVFELRFGELYAAIKYKKRRTTAKFEDIENP